MSSCPFCSKEIQVIDRDPTRDCLQAKCERCGRYEITGTVFAMGRLQNAYLISGVLRWRAKLRFEQNQLITSDSLKDLFSSQEIPQSIPDKIDKLIYYIGISSPTFGAPVKIDLDNDYPLTFSPHLDEFKEILAFLERAGLIELFAGATPGPFHNIREQLPYDGLFDCKFTMQGWNRFYEIEKKAVDTVQCFIAMNFAPEYDPAYNAIVEAVRECGFNPYCVKGLQHNDDITDLIIAGIRKSRFVVAEFSGERPSVYYEAGYAKGLRKEVIWVARRGELLHFDIRQYNHIIWSDTADLKSQLKARIEATIK